MAMPNKPPHYKARATTEDILALLVAAQEHQRVILLHAFHETPQSCDVIFDEARALRRTLEQAQQMIGMSWREVQALIDAGE